MFIDSITVSGGLQQLPTNKASNAMVKGSIFI
jgi:hypothetical protein